MLNTPVEEDPRLSDADGSVGPISVVIAAHNEATVIGRCLDALLADTRPGELEIVVVANGCSDDTATVAASRPGVQVINLTKAGKAQALNAGDDVATGFPRVYLDADVVLTPGALPRLAHALTEAVGQEPVPLAVMPRRHLNLIGRPLLVKGFYAINSRLPIFDDALFGRGAMAVSRAGRRRFVTFPDQMADDLFLDSQFASTEKREVRSVLSYVETPMRTRDLIRVQTRVRAGNAKLRAASIGVRSAVRSSWFFDVVLRKPWLAPAAVSYVAITVIAALKARRHTEGHWGRDDSTRAAAG